MLGLRDETGALFGGWRGSFCCWSEREARYFHVSGSMISDARRVRLIRAAHPKDAKGPLPFLIDRHAVRVPGKESMEKGLPRDSVAERELHFSLCSEYPRASRARSRKFLMFRSAARLEGGEGCGTEPLDAGHCGMADQERAHQ